MRRSEGKPITPGAIPGMCQPPVNAMELVDQLAPDELRQVMRTMIIWVPEAFEKGLQSVSETREIIADYHRQRAARGAR
jgi:hypothetical protein